MTLQLCCVFLHYCFICCLGRKGLRTKVYCKKRYTRCKCLQGVYGEIRVHWFQIHGWGLYVTRNPCILKSPHSDFHCNFRRFQATCNPHDNYVYVTGYLMPHGVSPYFLWGKNLQCATNSDWIFLILDQCEKSSARAVVDKKRSHYTNNLDDNAFLINLL